MSQLLIFAHFLCFGDRCERFAHDRSFPLSDVSESLRSLTKNERLWAIRSHRSEEMSDCEQIAQVAHQRWANEWIANFFSKLLIRSFLGKKWAIRSKNRWTICSENRWANSQPCQNDAFEQILFGPKNPEVYSFLSLNFQKIKDGF